MPADLKSWLGVRRTVRYDLGPSSWSRNSSIRKAEMIWAARRQKNQRDQNNHGELLWSSFYSACLQDFASKAKMSDVENWKSFAAGALQEMIDRKSGNAVFKAIQLDFRFSLNSDQLLMIFGQSLKWSSWESYSISANRSTVSMLGRCSWSAMKWISSKYVRSGSQPLFQEANV